MNAAAVGRVAETVVRAVVGTLLFATWAILGLVFWVPVTARVTARFVLTLLRTSLLGGRPDWQRARLQAAITFYPDGFRRIAESVWPPRDADEEEEDVPSEPTYRARSGRFADPRRSPPPPRPRRRAPAPEPAPKISGSVAFEILWGLLFWGAVFYGLGPAQQPLRAVAGEAARRGPPAVETVMQEMEELSVWLRARLGTGTPSRGTEPSTTTSESEASSGSR